MSIAGRIKSARERKGWTQKELASQMKVDLRIVRELELEFSDFDFSIWLGRVAKALDIDDHWLNTGRGGTKRKVNDAVKRGANGIKWFA